MCTLAQSVVDTHDKVNWSRQHIKRSLCVLHPDRRCKCGAEFLHKAYEICLASWRKPRNCVATPAPLPPTTPLPPPTGTTYNYFVHPHQLLSPRSAPPGLPMGCFGLDMYEKMFGPTSAEYPFGRDCWYGIQKDPVGVYWPSVFGGLGYQGQKTTLYEEHTGLLALPPSAAKRINQHFLQTVVFWPWYPRLPKKHLANKPLRDPSEVCSIVTTRHTSTAKVTT